MKNRKKQLSALILAVLMVLSLAACASGGGSSTASASAGGTSAAAGSGSDTQEESNFIANRTVTIQAYEDDIGTTIPTDISATYIGQYIKEETGIDVVYQYTPGESDSTVMAAQLASGNIPDAIVSYLNDSSRPEFPILLKAAKEGMFADLSSYFADAKIYSKYLEEGYLPNDTQKNIMFREDFDGAVYLVHLNIPRVDRSTTFEPDADYVDAMYIRKDIAEALEIEPKDLRTQEELYDLLVAIRDGGFTDDNGNAVSPLGPKISGGSVDALQYVAPEWNWAGDGEYNMIEGEFYHEAETEYALGKVLYVRRLLAEGLMNPEFFTMDNTRAKEVSVSGNSAIIGQTHNYSSDMGENWLPVGPLNDYTGSNERVATGKSGYDAWAVSAKAENPEEIFKLFDFMATYETKLISLYGEEGVIHEMVDGYPVLTDYALELRETADRQTLIDLGLRIGGAGGTACFNRLHTDTDTLEDFGEARVGTVGNQYETALAWAAYSPNTYRLVEGLPASSYLNHPEMASIQAQMSLLNYKETLVQAMYASSDAEAEQILGNFVDQLNAAGMQEFKDYLMQLYEADNKSIQLR